MTHKSIDPTIEEILDRYRMKYNYAVEMRNPEGVNKALPEATTQIKDLINKAVLNSVSKVDRVEVIDETGRAYVRGSIYGTPVKVELSLQDDGRTLKVFVKHGEEKV